MLSAVQIMVIAASLGKTTTIGHEHQNLRVSYNNPTRFLGGGWYIKTNNLLSINDAGFRDEDRNSGATYEQDDRKATIYSP